MKLFILLLLFVSGCSEVFNQSSVLLPEYNAEKMLDQCSRNAPKFAGAWTPRMDEIKKLEKQLKSDPKLPDYGQYKFQYVGIIYKGQQAIYINALAKHVEADGFFHKPMIYCDGGKMFWGAVYIVENQSIMDLYFNGSFLIE